MPITSIVSAADPARFEAEKFHIVEGDDLQVYLDRLESVAAGAPGGNSGSNDDDEGMAAEPASGADPSAAAPGSMPGGSTEMQTD